MRKIISYLQDNKQTIVICSTVIKDSIINYLNKNRMLLNVHFKTPSQVARDLLGEYSQEAVVSLVTKEGYHPEIANTIIKNLLLIEKQDYQHPKLNELVQLKNEYHKYYHKNNLYEYFYQNNQICFINPDFTNEAFTKAYHLYFNLNNIKTFHLGEESKKDLTIYAFESQKEEVEAFAEEVSKLLANNVKPENIKVHHLNESYTILIKNIFSFYNIDCNLDLPTQLNEYEIVKFFMNELSNHLDERFLAIIENALQILKGKVNQNNEDEINIYNNIIKITNKYNFFTGLVKDLLPLLEYEFSKATYNKRKKYLNAITMTNILEEHLSDEDHVFILGLNQNVFPIIIKDEDFLLDEEKRLLNLQTSTQMNQEIKRITTKMILTAKNTYLSYAKSSHEGELQKSSFIADLEKTHNVKEIKYKYITNNSYSQKRHRLLLSKLLDHYHLYEESSEELFLLLRNHPDILKVYRSYNNDFTGIDNNVLSSFLNENFSLSYTSINSFFNCQFRFMLERVLRLNRITNVRPLMIGNFFHYALENLLNKENLDFNKDYYKIVRNFQIEYDLEFDSKEQMFIKIYKMHLERIIPILQKQLQYSHFTIKSIEETFSVPIINKHKVMLNGKIDKILTYQDKEEHYAIVIDYKTGSNYFNYNKVIYGLDLQTLIYFYLLNNSSNNKYRFAGAYLQSLLPNQPLLNDANDSYQTLLEKELRWNGYTLKEKEIISLIDKFAVQKSFLNGIRFKNNGDLYATSLSKVITNDQFEALLGLVEQKIHECINEIILGNFKINPKDDGKVNSCTFCPFKDVCFRKPQNVERIIVGNNLDFLDKEVVD